MYAELIQEPRTDLTYQLHETIHYFNSSVYVIFFNKNDVYKNFKISWNLKADVIE